MELWDEEDEPTGVTEGFRRCACTNEQAKHFKPTEDAFGTLWVHGRDDLGMGDKTLGAEARRRRVRLWMVDRPT